MGWSLQNKAEHLAYDLLFELENEFNIEIGKVPEVYYVNKFTRFESLGINNFFKEDFNTLLLEKEAMFIPKNNLIITSRLDDFVLAEEVTHFIHYQFLDNHKNIYDEFGASSISEMLGFFCSKLIDSGRKNPYYGDLFLFKKNFDDIPKTILYMYKKNEFIDLVHQQGYSVGNKLYFKYLNSEISKEEIKKIMTKPLKRKDFAFYEFFYWKHTMLKDKL